MAKKLNDIKDNLRPLLKQHGISETDRNRWLLLAHELAGELTPKPRAKPSGKKKWTEELEIKLIRSVSTEVNINGLTITAACKKLSTNEPWKSLVKVAGSERTVTDVLRERYQKLHMDCFDIWEDVKTGELIVTQRPRRKSHRHGKYGT